MDIFINLDWRWKFRFKFIKLSTQENNYLLYWFLVCPPKTYRSQNLKKNRSYILHCWVLTSYQNNLNNILHVLSNNWFLLLVTFDFDVKYTFWHFLWFPYSTWCSCYQLVLLPLLVCKLSKDKIKSLLTPTSISNLFYPCDVHNEDMNTKSILIHSSHTRYNVVVLLFDVISSQN